MTSLWKKSCKLMVILVLFLTTYCNLEAAEKERTPLGELSTTLNNSWVHISKTSIKLYKMVDHIVAQTPWCGDHRFVFHCLKDPGGRMTECFLFDTKDWSLLSCNRLPGVGCAESDDELLLAWGGGSRKLVISNMSLWKNWFLVAKIWFSLIAIL